MVTDLFAGVFVLLIVFNVTQRKHLLKRRRPVLRGKIDQSCVKLRVAHVGKVGL